MCPACIATATLIAAGVSSTGGAVFFIKIGMKKGTNQPPHVSGTVPADSSERAGLTHKKARYRPD